MTATPDETIPPATVPSKARSALIAVPLAIVVEVICALLNVGGAVSLILAYLLSFVIVHQVRLRR